MRKLFSEGKSCSRLAELFGVSEESVRALVSQDELKERYSVAHRVGVNKGRVAKTWVQMIHQLSESRHSVTRIAKALGVSRTTVYYHLHPGKYQEKLDYVRRFRTMRKAGSYWEPEPDDSEFEFNSWEMEDG